MLRGRGGLKVTEFYEEWFREAINTRKSKSCDDLRLEKKNMSKDFLDFFLELLTFCSMAKIGESKRAQSLKYAQI